MNSDLIPFLCMALNGIPGTAGKAREDWIFAAVCAGEADFSFSNVVSSSSGRSARFSIFSDALKIGGVRVCVTAETEQKIADVLGCSLLTPKLADLAWEQRDITLPPFPRGNTNGMSDTQAMLDHSAKIDAALAKINSVGLVGTVGKHWVIDNDLLKKPGMAMNYGWHFSGPNFQGIDGEPVASLLRSSGGSFYRLIQGRGTRHDTHHSDYSQVCVLVKNVCEVDGDEYPLSHVLTDPELAPLASHQGVMRLTRQPGVEEVKGLRVFNPFNITPEPDLV